MTNIIQNLSFDLTLFKLILRAKMVNFKTLLIDKFINLAIWALCSVFVSGYLLQAFGLSKNYGPFQFGGVLAAVGLFELYTNTIIVLSDLEGDQTIAYYLTLPASALTVLFAYVCYFALITGIMAFMLLPLGKLMLYSQLVLAPISWIKLFLFMVLSSVTLATAVFMLAALIPSMDKLDILWNRFIFPLWFLGGFQFSWASVNKTMPLFSFVMLCNPITYMSEGTRAALLGQEGNINFWICFSVLLVLLMSISIGGYVLLKKRLDFV